MTQTSDKRPTREEIEALLPRFIGEIDQLPPQFSALKVGGKRAYDVARSGEVAELKPRKIHIKSFKIAEYTPEYTTFTCHCGKGTYIRSLARDLGRLMGCFGYVSMLRRTATGKFSEKDAISLEVMADLVHKDGLSFVRPVESALDDIPALEIDSNQAMLLKRGQPISISQVVSDTVLARCEGKLVAICDASLGQIKPVRVFNL